MTDREELVNSCGDIGPDFSASAPRHCSLVLVSDQSIPPQLLALVSDQSILQQSGTFRSHSYRNPHYVNQTALPSSNNRTQQQAPATAATASLSEAENSPRTSTRTDSENHSQLR